MKVGAHHCPPLTAPHLAPDGHVFYNKLDPIDLVVRCNHWFRPLIGALLPVVVLKMGSQQPRRQLHLAVWTPNYLLLLLPKIWTHSRHLPYLRRLQLPVENVEGPAHHPNRFVYVSLEVNPIEHSLQDIQFRLDPGRPGRCDKAIIGVEEFLQPLDFPSKAVRSRLISLHQCYPVPNHRVNHHGKDGWRESIPMGDPSMAI